MFCLPINSGLLHTSVQSSARRAAVAATLVRCDRINSPDYTRVVVDRATAPSLYRYRPILALHTFRATDSLLVGCRELAKRHACIEISLHACLPVCRNSRTFGAFRYGLLVKFGEGVRTLNSRFYLEDTSTTRVSAIPFPKIRYSDRNERRT